MTLLLALLLSAAPTKPSRQPVVTHDSTKVGVFVYDPNAPGASAGTPNVTSVVPGGTGCAPSQAIGVYDDGGTVGVNCIDTSNVATQTFTDQTSHPATPSAGSTIVYEWIPSSGAVSQSMERGSVMGLPVPEGLMAPFAMLGTTANWRVDGCMPIGFGSSVFSQYGVTGATPCACFCSAAGPTWANTNLFTRSPVHQDTKATPTTTSTWCGCRFATPHFWRGVNAGEGGFFWSARVFFASAPNDGNSVNKSMVGLIGNPAAPTGTTNPSAFTDTAYFGNDPGEAQTLHWCTNDNSGASTCHNNLGANFPIQSGAWYDFYIWAPPAASSIYGAVVRLDSAQNSGLLTASSDLPRNTVQLGWYSMLGSAGSDAGVTSIAQGGAFTMWNY